MDFHARAQVVAAARMSEEHTETMMIQRALIGGLEPQEDQALQKIGRKKPAKSAPVLMELPDLNAALVEAYQNLDHTTRVAKEMARRIKMAQQQTKWASKLWQAAGQKLTLLEQQHHRQQPFLLLVMKAYQPLFQTRALLPKHEPTTQLTPG